MKIAFESWIREKDHSLNVMKLFEESFTCYRNSAYRASLLFSHLAFLTIIKELIIKSDAPPELKTGRWTKLIQDLNDDDRWEKEVFEQLINSKAPIFNISENIRQQIKYWKDRRNDCAHFKDNEIEAHHTEAFWSFLKSNLQKITIEGGMQSLLNKFYRHYDPHYTPPNTDPTSLIKEIDEAVRIDELDEFWKTLFVKIGHDFAFEDMYETTVTKIVKLVFQNCNDQTVRSLVNHLKTNGHDLAIINVYPETFSQFEYSASEIREIWTKRAWRLKTLVFKIVAVLFSHGAIPFSEIKEANQLLISKATDCRPQDDWTHTHLAANGFGNEFFEIALNQNRLYDRDKWVP
ncbi:MAG TPA: hypothetical protein DCG19_08425, partial [Cryomorphaceae bacterium]|nr:hypothetical protein [Cryomorphaceae bacterium]